MDRHASLNRFYRLRWSEAHQAWIPVAETSRGRGKAAAAVLAVLSLLTPLALAGPTGGQVQAGQGSISTSGAVTTVQQSSSTLTLNWQSFNVAPNETVKFVQPGASAIAVNRIADVNGSQILGHLSANGQVWLINPNGVYFGRGAQVDVGSLVASTLDVSDADVGRGTRRFAGEGKGSVVNEGTIRAGEGGYVALLGNRVSNQGVISAQRGTVALGAGSALTLSFEGNQLLGMHVDRSTLDNLADNGQLIQADGGRVIMTAGAKDAVLASVVNNTGVIQARTVEQHEGSIVLLGGMQAGTTKVAGMLDASAPEGGNGGFIETSAAHVKVAEGAKVSTAASRGHNGMWLVDPQDFTVAASGGDISGAALSSNLASGNITLQSTAGSQAGNGDIFVNDAVTWSANTTLTLSAQRNIVINAPIDASGSASAKVALEYGQRAPAAGNTDSYFVHAPVSLPAGPNFSTKLGSDGATTGYTVITSLGAKGSATGTDLQGMQGSGMYVLGSDIDASPTRQWVDNGGSVGFAPITFNDGTVDGLGHIVTGLTACHTNSGLFAYVGAGATVRNLGLVNVDMHASWLGTDGAIAATNYGTLYNVYSTGIVGGEATIQGIYFSGAPSAGGLVGINGGSIASSFSRATVRGSDFAGGLVGQNESGSRISDSYAAGWVHSNGKGLGGLVGENKGLVSNSYAVSTLDFNKFSQQFGSLEVGGLVGRTSGGGAANNSFDSGQSRSTFADAGWDLTNTWLLYEGQSTPLLRSLLTPRTLGSANVNKVYDGIAFTGSELGWSGPVDPSALLGTLNLGAAQGARNAGTYAIVPSGLYSDQLAASGHGGYAIDFINGSLNITPRALIISAGTEYRTYDGTTSAMRLPKINGLQSGDSVSAAQAFASKDVLGTNGSTLSISGYVISDGNGGQNYIVTTKTALGTITPAPLTIDAVSDIRAYNGTSGSTLTPTVSGVKSGDSVSATTQAYASKNAMGTDGSTLIVTGYTLTDGNNGANYVVTTSSASGTITPAALSIAGAVAANKVYDGSTTASVSGGSLTGALIGDDVTLNTAGMGGSFGDKNVGAGKAVSVTGVTLSGADSGNYSFVQPTGLSASITPASLTIAAVSDSRTYNGTTSSKSAPTVAGTLYGSDALSGVTQAFASRNVLGAGASTLSVSGYTVNDGNNGQNYTVTTQTTSGTITPASLTIAATSDSRMYNGTTSSTSAPTVTGTLYGSDALSGVTQAFASKDVLGAGASTLNVTGYALNDGNGGANYAVATQTASGTITPASLTIAAVSDSRTYDGTTSSAGAPTVTGTLYGSDALSGVTQAFASKNVLGAGASMLNVSGYTVNDGNGGANYAIATQTASGTITPASLTIAAVSDNRTYNGTTSSTGASTVTGTLYGSDALSGVTQAFASKDVLGAGASTLNVTGYTLNDGNGGANYTVATQTASGTITPASLTIAAVSDSRTYDGTTISTDAPTVTGTLYGSDALSGVTQAFASKNVLGTGASMLNVTGYTVNDGNGGANYAVTAQTASGTITPAPLTIAAVSDSRTYNGTTSSTDAPTVAGTLYGSDALSGVTQAFASKNVLGAGASTLNVSGYTVNDGNGGANYAVTTQTASGTITPASLTIAAVSDSRTYNGTTSSTDAPTVAGTLYGSDALSGVTQAFASKNVLGENASTLNVSGYTVNDGNSGHNYAVTTQTASGTITPASLTIGGAIAANKVYDGTTAASISGERLAGVLAGDDVTLNGGPMNASFADKNAGSAKQVSVTGFALSGADAGNYSVAQPTGLSADITPATLLYVAAPAWVRLGDELKGLGGTVSGFMPGDTQATATTGSLVWDTNAPSSERPGWFAIDGAGLSAQNYRFEQAPGNATALALGVVNAPQTVLQASAQLQAQAAPRVQTENTDEEDRQEMLLRIVDGGVRLPANIVQPR